MHTDVRPTAVVSLVLGGYDSWALDAALRSVLRATVSSPIVVHLCGNLENASQPNGALHPQCALPNTSTAMSSVRVLRNPQRLPVSKHTPRVLAAHMSNFLLCDSAPHACHHHPLAKFVMLAANQMLWRPGLEAHVARYAFSFCMGFECNTLRLPLVTSGNVAGTLHTHLADLSWEVNRSRLYRHTLDAAAGKRDTEEVHASPRSAFHMIFTHGLAPGWQHSPINTYPHEGSFYPVWMMREFVGALRSTVFARAVLGGVAGGVSVGSEAATGQTDGRASSALDCIGLKACNCIYREVEPRIQRGGAKQRRCARSTRPAPHERAPKAA